MIEGGDLDAREARTRASIRRHLERDFPTADAGLIASVLVSCYERTADATVQHYRWVFAERETRAVLRREASRLTAARVAANRGAA